MTTIQQTQKTNYEILLDTVNSLKNSQGFYSRLARDLNEMTVEEKEQIKQGVNALPQWKDSLDCVMYLEE